MLDTNKLISDVVQRNIEKLISGTYKLGTDKYNEFKTRSGSAFKTYLEYAVNKYSKAKTILYRDTPVFLYDFYVEADLKCNRHIIQAQEIDNIISVSKYIIITGTAGAGKSTFLKHLFLTTIKSGDFIPVFVELRNLNQSNLSVKNFIYKTLNDFGFSLEEKFFDKALESGKFVFFFDGLDEVNSEKRDDISLEIQSYADKFNKNFYIVSSRPDSSFISWSNYTEMQILPLSKDKAYQLIEKIDYDVEIKNKFLEGLGDKLYKEHQSFVSNPLLLTIMLMTFNQFAEIPDKMHIFYEQAYDTLYSKHDATKTGYKRKMNSDLAKDDFKKVLSCFSFLSYFNNDVSFDVSKINGYLGLVKQLTSVEFDNDKYIEDLVKALCLLVQDGLVYTYTHRTFQEYFSALYIVTLSEEILKEILPEIFNRGDQDKVFDILYEIEKVKTEQHLLIPELKKLRQKIQYEEGDLIATYKKYLNLAFSSFRITWPNEDNDHIGGVSVTIKKFKPTSGNKDAIKVAPYKLVKFVTNQYNLPKIKCDIPLGGLEIVDLCEKYIPIYEQEVEYDMKVVLKNDELFNDAFGDRGYFFDTLCIAIKILEYLEDKNINNRNSIISLLLNKK